MRLFFLILSLSIGICAHSQNKQALSKSDSLFAKGVELYNQGNYKAAIPLFTESDKIDSHCMQLIVRQSLYSTT